MIRHCRHLIVVVVCGLLLPLRVLAAGADDVELRPGVPIILSREAPGPVRMAVEDLRRDLEKVFGTVSPVVEDVASAKGQSAIVIAGPGWSGADWHLDRVSGREAHALHVARRGESRYLVLEGADVRGAIYAIYSFSDEFLGIPPLWFWANWTPTRKDRVLVPGDTARVFASPDVRWRAWFNNDTDFLTPWRSRSPENDAAVYETVLRLKYNTYEVGSIADFSSKAPRYAVNADSAKAHARGLVLTGHHISSCGSNLRDWERFWSREKGTVPKLSVTATNDLETFWRYHIETAKRAGLEMVWTIAFRGGGDIPYWETFEDAPKEMSARADILNAMLRRQVALLKEITGDAAPPMRVTFYNEGTTLLTAGLLKPPEEPSLIWNFVSARRDHFPPEVVLTMKTPPNRLLGYYLNFQFTSTGSHLAAAEGPWKMASNYRALAKAGQQALAFTVVNAGNIREHLTELSANADMMWRFDSFEGGRFLENFSARYFGQEVAAAVAKLYRDYYYAYWSQKPGDLPDFERQYLFQDQRYARAAEMLLKDMAAGVRRPNPLEGHPLDNPDKGSVGYFRVEPTAKDRNQLEAMLRGTRESGARFAAVQAKSEALRSQVTTQGQRFFDDNLVMRAHIMTQLNQMLEQLALAYQAEDKSPERGGHLRQAAAALDRVQKDFELLSVAPLVQWYSTDRLFGVAALKKRIEEAAAVR